MDGRYVRLIPFTGGSGTITAGTLITCGSATAKVIGIYSAINTAPVLTGVATGWIKVTEWNGVSFPTSGTFTQAGYTFTISGPDIVGWIELVGDESSTITANRLGQVNFRGEWFEVGTTAGARTDTYQLPTNGSAIDIPGVWLETGVGNGLYEFWPCAGTVTATATTMAPSDFRGKVCWITRTTGILRFGHDGTNSAGGVLPDAGRRIRIPNIITANCTAAARGTNAVPNATIGTRYDFTTTGGGVFTGDVYFLINGWRLSVNLQNVRVTGVLYSDDFDTAYYTPSMVAQYPVSVSALVTTVSTGSSGGTSGPTAAQIRAEIDSNSIKLNSIKNTVDTLPTQEETAYAVWNTPVSIMTNKSTIGGYISKVLLSIPKFLGLK